MVHYITRPVSCIHKILIYALLLLTPVAKTTGCYKFDVSVCLSVAVV